MVRVAIVCKPQKKELARLLPELIAWLCRHGYEPLLDLEGGQYTTAAPAMDRAEMPDLGAALVIVLGGDGTLLSVARIFAATGTPILSVNLGFLGFLTEVRLADLYSTLEGWCTDCHVLDARAMLHAELWREGELQSSFRGAERGRGIQGRYCPHGRLRRGTGRQDRGPLPRRRGHRLHPDRFHGLYAGRQRPHSHPGRGRAGGDAHLPAPAHAAAHRGARRCVAHRPGRRRLQTRRC